MIYNMISSAYNDILLTVLFVLYPCMLVLELIDCARGSRASAKSRGDSEQPCLEPLYRLKGGERILLVRILAHGL